MDVKKDAATIKAERVLTLLGFLFLTIACIIWGAGNVMVVLLIFFAVGCIIEIVTNKIKAFTKSDSV